MTERVLGTRELNRAVLARQGLLEPSTAPIAQTIAAVGGLQAQYAPIELRPFEPLDAATKRELRLEADRLAAFHA